MIEITPSMALMEKAIIARAKKFKEEKKEKIAPKSQEIDKKDNEGLLALTISNGYDYMVIQTKSGEEIKIYAKGSNSVLYVVTDKNNAVFRRKQKGAK